jgi:hypothetical protein
VCTYTERLFLFTYVGGGLWHGWVGSVGVCCCCATRARLPAFVCVLCWVCVCVVCSSGVGVGELGGGICVWVIAMCDGERMIGGSG